MENRTVTAIPSSRYDDFLFAIICEEPNGTQLTVFSALTRVDIDPWEEAARLAAMTEPIAKSRLIALLNQASEKGSTQIPAIAAQLIARLRSANDKSGLTTDQLSAVNGRLLIFLLCWWSFTIAVAFFSGYQQRVHKTEDTSAPSSSATILSENLGADIKTKGATD